MIKIKELSVQQINAALESLKKDVDSENKAILSASFPTKWNVSDESGENQGTAVVLQKNQQNVTLPMPTTIKGNFEGYLEGTAHYAEELLNDSIIDKVYPVGSIYMSVNSANPGTVMGGTWEELAPGRVLVGAGTVGQRTFTGGDTGGEYSNSYTPSGTVGGHTLTTSEIPSHTHTFTGDEVTSSANNRGHTHTVTATGSVSVTTNPTFTGDEVTSGANNRGHTHSVTATGSVSVTTNPTFTGSAVTSGANNRGHTHSVTATGSISGGEYSFTGTAVTSGANNRGHTHSVTAAGTVSSHSHTINTGNTSSSGTKTTVGFRFASGSTSGHQLTAKQIPAHTHTVTGSKQNGSSAGGVYKQTEGWTTRETSSAFGPDDTSTNLGNAHSHTVSSITGYLYGSTDSTQPTFTGSAVTSGGESQNHTHSVTAAGTIAVTTNPTFTGSVATSGGESQNHTHSVTAAGTISGGAYKFTGTSATSGGENQNHTHKVTASGTISGGAYTFTGTSATSGGESQNHTHKVTATGSNSNTGGGGSHSHSFTGSTTTISAEQPYLVVYMWKRVA